MAPSRLLRGQAVTNVFQAIVHGIDDFEPTRRPGHQPTTAEPGTKQKMDVMRERLEMGVPIWHKDDPVYEHSMVRDDTSVLMRDKTLSTRMDGCYKACSM